MLNMSVNLASSAVSYLPIGACAGESLSFFEFEPVRFWKQTIFSAGQCLTHRCGILFSENASAFAFAIHSVVGQLLQPSLLTSFLFGTHKERAMPFVLTLSV
jgi:hypothetical protein